MDRSEMTHMQRLAVDLRAAADIVEKLDPEDFQLYNNVSITLCVKDSEAAPRLGRAARKFGKSEKVVSDWSFIIRKSIGDVTLQAYASRDAVCTAVEEEVAVPEEVIEATEAKVIPAHTRTVKKWNCPPSLLDDTGDPHAL